MRNAYTDTSGIARQGGAATYFDGDLTLELSEMGIDEILSLVNFISGLSEQNAVRNMLWLAEDMALLRITEGDWESHQVYFGDRVFVEYTYFTGYGTEFAGELWEIEPREIVRLGKYAILRIVVN